MKKFLTILLMSITLISLEMVWTRVLSAEFFYTFSFLILSNAILGLGLGALTVRLLPKIVHEPSVGISLSLSGIFAVLGPVLVFKLGLEFSQLLNNPLMLVKLALAIILLGLAYFFAGIGLSILFRINHKQMPRLYMADLVGAGLGVIVGILFMNWFGTPNAAFLMVLPVLVASFLYSPKFLKIIPLLLFIGIFIVQPFSEQWLQAPQRERGTVYYKHWDAMAKIKMFSYPNDEARGIVIDNIANTPVYKFDGEFAFPEGTPKDQWGIPVGDLIRRFDDCTFLSLGSGGGGDVLQALMEGATEVHAVEVNPWINKMVQEGDSTGYIAAVLDTLLNSVPDLPEYTSYLYNDPRVVVASEDARAYVQRYKNEFDVIYSLSSNTFSALASGAFAMAENYLFTTEAFEDYWYALSDSGFMMMEHQFYMPRLVSDLIGAFENMGIDNYKDHFAVYNLPQMRRNALLISKQPLTNDIMQTALTDLSPETFPQIHLLYPAADSLKDNLIQQIVDNGWESQADSVAFNISPTTDDRPFVAQMGLWKNLQLKGVEKLLPYEFYGFPLTKMIIVAILIVVTILVIPLNLLPYFFKGEKLKAVPWLYFFTIGMAFMIVEVVLIQKYTLFVGPSVYSIATILLTILIFSGIGSNFSNKVKDTIPFAGIIAWLLLDVFVFVHLTDALGFLTQAGRISVTAFLIAPLGFFMGMPFPKAGLRVGELVDWGFAVNGAASVLGSTAIMLVVFSFGYSTGLLVGLVLYAMAFGLLSAKKAWA